MSRKKIIVSLFLATIFTACSGNSKDVSDAKKQLLAENNKVYEQSEILEERKDAQEDLREDALDEDVEMFITDTDPVVMTNLSGVGLFDFDPISASNLAMGKVTISGEADPSIKKIIVQFHNDSSKMPKDDHILSEYTRTAPDFRYNAFPEFDVFDFGTNVYTFSGYDESGKILAQSRISIKYNADDKSYPVSLPKDIKIQEVRFKNDDIKLPISQSYGEPVVTTKNISYSNINNFEIRSYDGDFSCDAVTQVFQQMNLGYFYWNTCRLLKEGVYSVYLVQKTSDRAYGYYKYYFDTDNDLVSYVLLENGDLQIKSSQAEDAADGQEKTPSISSEDISLALKQKNDEIKQKNASFSVSQITDNLMKNID